jgi:2-dehydro-3-deoxy-D-arabinonate dehydratase
MTHEVIRFIDNNGDVKVGVREQGDSTAHLLSVENLAQLLTLEKAPLLSTIKEALQNTAIAEVSRLLPPVDALTEVWAAGVTYKRSRAAREEESDQPDVYSRVYDAARPELFFKSVAWRVVGTGESIGVRSDSPINAPEPEIALVCNSYGEIVGVTICNDVSSRSIEGENPLYLPQAKIYSGSCALGPGFVPIDQISDIYNLEISVAVTREGNLVWDGVTSTREMHRTFEDLVSYLFLHLHFPQGVILSTGTGLVPSMEFNLSTGDEVTVGIAHVGTLVNIVKSAANHLQLEA